MATLGETLYAARSAREETLEDVARVLRIRPAILQALEAGNIAALPSGAVVKGFVRTYTKYLGLDGDQAVRLFEEEAGSHTGKSPLVFPEFVEAARLPGMGTLFAGLVIAGFAVASWYAYTNREGLGIERVGELPDRLFKLISGDQDDGGKPAEAMSPAQLVPDEDDRQVTGAQEVLPAPDEVAGGAGNRGRDSRLSPQSPAMKSDRSSETAGTLAPRSQANPPGPVIAAVLPPLTGDNLISEAEEEVRKTTSGAEAALTASRQDATPPESMAGAATETAALTTENPSPPGTAAQSPLFAVEGKIYGDTGGVPRVVVRALGDSWVQVRNSAGRTVFSQIMRKGDIYRVPADPGLRMIAGSVGDLEFWVDGTALSPLGGKGRVRRDIPLDAGRLTRLGPG